MSFKSNMARAVAVLAAAATLTAVTAAPASAANRYVLVVNHTSHTLTRLYAAGRVYAGGYTDWLGRSTLAPGASMIINFSDGSGYCRMTIVGQFNDGDTVSENGFNVCAEPQLEFTGN
jgi:hypothetical protein